MYKLLQWNWKFWTLGKGRFVFLNLSVILCYIPSLLEYYLYIFYSLVSSWPISFSPWIITSSYGTTHFSCSSLLINLTFAEALEVEGVEPLTFSSFTSCNCEFLPSISVHSSSVARCCPALWLGNWKALNIGVKECSSLHWISYGIWWWYSC